MTDTKLFVLAVFIVLCSTLQWSNSCVLRYSELQNLGAACPPEDTCSMPRQTDSIYTNRCQCKSSCVLANTCCIDSPYVHQLSAARTYRRQICSTISHTAVGNILFTSRCGKKWRGSQQIKSLCENPSYSLRDPMGIAPVTSITSRTTYSNYFCALCNDDVQSAEFWIAKLEQRKSSANKLPDDERGILDKLVFNDEIGEWEITSKYSNGSDIVEIVTMTFYPTKDIQDMVHPCISDVVSECDARWRHWEYRRMCESYMGLIYVRRPNWSSRTYRNVHCAICNFETYNSTTICQKEIIRSSPGVSFAHLLDVNLSTGNKVGYVERCDKGEVYDKFFNKCRTMMCALPGYVLKNDKCVKS